MTDNANTLTVSEAVVHESDRVIKELRISIGKVRRAALSLESSVSQLEEGTDSTKRSVEALVS
jgi:exonuclease VII small subunit